MKNDHSQASGDETAAAEGTTAVGPSEQSQSRPHTGRSSAKIVVAMLIGRALGLLRDRAILGFAGYTAVSDVLGLGLRIANSVQNLLGDQALSAGFIPSYSKRLAEARSGTPGGARALAGAVFARLMVAASVLALVGVAIAPKIGLWVSSGDAESVSLLSLSLRFLFPMAALIVLAAWCMAVLNSHRKFFLTYLAPAAWNLAILGGLAVLAVQAGEPDARTLVLFVSAGAFVGGVLQLGVQLPSAIAINGGLPLTLSGAVSGVKEVQQRIVPVLFGRGSLQLIGIAEAAIAFSLLAEGTAAALQNGQRLFFLILMLCSMVQGIVYLPEFSRISDNTELRKLFREALHGVWFLVVPAIIGIVGLGYPALAALLRVGNFDVPENAVAYVVLAVYTLGLLPSASSRILQSLLYSRGQTALPAAVGVGRAGVSLGFAYATMAWWDAQPASRLAELGLTFGETMPPSSLMLGALAFATASAICAYGEWLLLRRLAKVGRLDFVRRAVRFGGIALASLVPALAAWWLFWQLGRPGEWTLGSGPVFSLDLYLVVRGVVVVSTFLASYLLLAWRFRLREFEQLVGTAFRPG